MKTGARPIKSIFAFLAVMLLFAGSAGASPESRVLSTELGARLDRVAEFRLIREEARTFGVRAWLFGGLATSYGHYVREDLRREAKRSYRRGLDFDYNLASFTTLFQDYDIVIDGTAEQAAQLEARLHARFPGGGEKSLWEVRPLREARPPKDPLLGNQDFLNQNNDSASTGMIELTPPSQGEERVRDLRAFEMSESPFLEDLASGGIRYYSSEDHRKTKLFKKGRNPEILSVLRYLIKLSRHGLAPSEGDLATLKKVVDKFNPATDLSHEYLKGWVPKHVQKLVEDAVNLEELWKLLDELGLRQKLLKVGDPKELNSVAWWMNREPLKSAPVGQGTGKTAAELGVSVVAHETSDFMAYESIRRTTDGGPNVFISRGKGTVPGETAFFGDGFYVADGKEGRRNRSTGYTVRFRLKPNAREKSDFLFLDSSVKNKELIILNRAALEVIPEDASFGLFSYYLLLAEGNPQMNGLLERHLRKSGNAPQKLEPAERKAIWELIEKEYGKETPNLKFITEWLASPFSQLDPEIEAGIIQRSIDESTRNIPFLGKGGGKERTREAFKSRVNRRLFPHWLKHPLATTVMPGFTTELERLLDRWIQDEPGLFAEILREPYWSKHPKGGEWVLKLLHKSHKGPYDFHSITNKIFSERHWQQHPQWQEFLAAYFSEGDANGDAVIMESVLGVIDPRTEPLYVSVFSKMVDRNRVPPSTYRKVLQELAWARSPAVYDLLEKIARVPGIELDEVAPVLAALDPKNPRSEEVLKLFLAKLGPTKNLLISTVPRVDWWDVPTVRQIAKDLPDLKIPSTVMNDMLWQMSKHPYGATLLRQYIDQTYDITVLRNPDWVENPAFLDLLESGIRNTKVETIGIAEIFERPKFKDHPVLRAVCDGKDPTFKGLKRALARGRTLKPSRNRLVEGYCGLREYLKILVLKPFSGT